MLITSKLKDNILSEFKEVPTNGSFNMREFADELNLDIHLLDSIFKEFEEIGLMELQRCIGLRQVLFFLKPAFSDFVRSGGFVAREKTEILKNKQLELNVQLLEIELNKLKSEIEVIKKTNPTLAERMLTIMSNIASITGVPLHFI